VAVSCGLRRQFIKGPGDNKNCNIPIIFHYPIMYLIGQTGSTNV